MKEYEAYNAGTVERVLAAAKGEVGTKESPPGSNRTKYNEWYGAGWQGQPWCAIFISWLFSVVVSLMWGMLPNPNKFASCTVMLAAAEKENMRYKPEQVKVGDVVIYDFNGDKKPEHCGLVYEVITQGGNVTSIKAYEGNTSPDEKGSQSDGGMVCAKTRPITQVMGVIRPAYAPSPKPEWLLRAEGFVDELARLGYVTSPQYWKGRLPEWGQLNFLMEKFYNCAVALDALTKGGKQ